MEQRRALVVAHPEPGDQLDREEMRQRAEGDLLGRGMPDDPRGRPTGPLRHP
jgi:hypothetical protein